MKIRFLEDSKKYGIPFWQHPEFLFLMLGLFCGLFSLLIFTLSQKYILSPPFAALLTLFFALLFLIFSFLICQTFEKNLEMNKIKNALLTILSHNLKSPLASIAWAIELLENKELSKEKEVFEYLKKGVAEMQKSLRKISFLTKIDFAQKEKVLLSDLTKEVLENEKEKIQQKDLKVFLQTENEKKVDCPKNQIKFVIENLIENAVSYSPEKKQILIKIFGKKNKVFFKIEDEAGGIPKEEKEQLFQMFFRAKKVRYSSSGWGLGLFLSKMIVEKLGGKIGYSPKKEGSIFWFYLKT